MNECLIDNANAFVEFLKKDEAQTIQDEDTETLFTLHKALKGACCSGPRTAAEKGIAALYKKIVLTKIEDMKEGLLQIAQQQGFDQIRFKGHFRVNRRTLEEYDQIIS
tara:strand:- start:99 stop:422 length:324 start_codon:yes stop_codon:yes gene_type:complete